jgi:hypothetical protein
MVVLATPSSKGDKCKCVRIELELMRSALVRVFSSQIFNIAIKISTRTSGLAKCFYFQCEIRSLSI